MDAMSIGRLAELSGVKVTTIRYYETIGMMAVPLRSGGNRRVYGQADVERLTFIRRSREFGLTMEAIRSLLAVAADQGQSCQAAIVIATAHVAELERRIRELEALKAHFTSVIARCTGEKVGSCTILQALHGVRQP